MTVWKDHTGRVKSDTFFTKHFHMLTVNARCSFTLHYILTPWKLDAQEGVHMHLLCWSTLWAFIPLSSTSIMACGRAYCHTSLILCCFDHIWLYKLVRIKNDSHSPWSISRQQPRCKIALKASKRVSILSIKKVQHTWVFVWFSGPFIASSTLVFIHREWCYCDIFNLQFYTQQ